MKILTSKFQFFAPLNCTLLLTLGDIPHKTQKCKGIHSTVQAEIIKIDS